MTFKIRDMGAPSIFLGMEVRHDPANSCISLSQSTYIKELASKFHLPVELRPTTIIRSDFYSNTTRKVYINSNHHQNAIQRIGWSSDLCHVCYSIFHCMFVTVFFCTTCTSCTGNKPCTAWAT